jgi:hypothetical protein
MMHALFAVVLLVGDLFHPFHVFPVDGSRNGNMRHGGGGGGAMPMFDLWRAPDHVARFDVFYRASPYLCPANASGHDQVLPGRVRVPGGSGPWLEGDRRPGKGRRISGRKQRVDTDMAGKECGRPCAGSQRTGPRDRLRRVIGFGG